MNEGQTLRELVLDSFDVDEAQLQHGVITNIKTINSYAPYYYDQFTCEQPDGTYPPTHGSSIPTLEEAEDFLGNYPELEDGSIKYDPEIAICLELDDEEQLFHFKSGFSPLSRWKPVKSIVQTIHQQVGVTEVSEDNVLPVIYDQTNIYALSDNGVVNMSRRLHEGEPIEYKFLNMDEPTEYQEDCTQLATYLDYLDESHGNPTHWVETNIESTLLPDTGTLPVLVNTPLGATRFVFKEGRYNNMGYEELAEKIGIDKPSELSDKSVYIRPRYKKFHDNIKSPRTNVCEYTAVADDSELWELAVVDPNATSETSITQRSAHSLKMNVENSFLEKAVRNIRRKISRLV